MDICEPWTICFIDTCLIGISHLVCIIGCSIRMVSLLKKYPESHVSVAWSLSSSFIFSLQLIILSLLAAAQVAYSVVVFTDLIETTVLTLSIVAHVWSFLSWFICICTVLVESKRGFPRFSPLPWIWILLALTASIKLGLVTTKEMESGKDTLKYIYYGIYPLYLLLAMSGLIELYKKREFESYGISINAIDYGYVYSPFAEQASDEKSEEKEEDNVSLNLDENEETERKSSIFSTLYQLFKFASEERAIISFGLLMAMIAGILEVVANKFFSPMIDAGLPGGGGKSRVVELALQLLAIYAALGICTSIAKYLFLVGSERMSARLRVVVVSTITKQEMSFFDKNKSGELASRLSADVTILAESLRDTILILANNITSVLVGMIIMFSTLWQLTLIMLSVLPVVVIIFGIQAVLIENLQEKSLNALAKANDTATEIFSLFRIVRSFGKERYESQRYQTAIIEQFQVNKKKALVEGVFEGILYFLYYSPLVLAIWFGVFFIIDGKFSVGDLFTFMLISLQLIWATMMITSIIPELGKLSGSSIKLLKLLKRVPKMENEKGDSIDYIKGDIVFNEVNFTYPSRPDQKILHNFNIDVKAGEKVALVGPSGSGKSTVVSLIERFYDSEGDILIDGISIKTLSPTALRRWIGLVAQDPALFASTIRENILYGRESATDEEMQEAARIANAHEFIVQLPKGYNTQIGERGITLSGGQKQRIAIARAVLKNPRILLLDEATSALDSSSEREVQDALDKLMEGRTCIVVAHRLSTIRNADRIAVLQRGKIVEIGTHRELLNSKGIYKTLYEKQISSDVDLTDLQVQNDVVEEVNQELERKGS